MEAFSACVTVTIYTDGTEVTPDEISDAVVRGLRLELSYKPPEGWKKAHVEVTDV